MSQFLGFITAFFVVGWAVRWYFRLGQPAPEQRLPPVREPQVITNTNRWETLDEVALLEPFTDPIVIEARPRVLLSDNTTMTADDVTDADATDIIDVVDVVAVDEPVEADATDVAAAEVVESTDTAHDHDHEVVTGFCARCRDKREVVNPVLTHTKKGKSAIRGTCAVCGAGMFVFISEEKAESGEWQETE